MSGIPPARDTDAEDVSWALQTAETQWKRNDRKDALVWLRRASQAAVEAMDDDRGIELARRAAEIEDQLAREAKPLESLIPVSLEDLELDEATDVRPSLPPLTVDDYDVQSLPPSAPPEGTAPAPEIPRAPAVPAIAKGAPSFTSNRSPNVPLPAGILSQIGRTQIDSKATSEDDTDHPLDARTLSPPRHQGDAPTLPPLRGGRAPAASREHEREREQDDPTDHQVDLPTPTPPRSGRSTAPPDPVFTPAPLPNMGEHDDDDEDTDVGHSVGIHVKIPQALLRPPLESQTDLLTLSEPAPPPSEEALAAAPGPAPETGPVPHTSPRKAEPLTVQLRRPELPSADKPADRKGAPQAPPAPVNEPPKPVSKDPPTVAVKRPDLPNLGSKDPPTVAARRPDFPKEPPKKAEAVTVSFKRPDPAAIAAAEAEHKAKLAAKAAPASDEGERARESKPADEPLTSRADAAAAEARAENLRPGPPRPAAGSASVRPGPPRPTAGAGSARPNPSTTSAPKPAQSPAPPPTRASSPIVRVDERAEPESEAPLPPSPDSGPDLETSAKTPPPPAAAPAPFASPGKAAPARAPTTNAAPTPSAAASSSRTTKPPPRDQQITRTNELDESLTLEPVREPIARRAEPSTRQVAALSEGRAEEILADTPEPSRKTPATVSLDLSDVEAFADLPEDARETFAAAATLTKLTSGEEVADFALAYVVAGEVDVSATIVDATASQLGAGGVLRAHGTPEESVPLRLVCTSQDARVATWSADAVEAAFKSCPWVEDDLRAASDQVQTLAGVTMGPLGDRLDVSLRHQVTSRLKVRSLLEGETIVEAGAAVPGIVVVGVGKLELVDKAGKVVREVRSGDFLFPEQVLGAGPAPHTARAGNGGALVMVGDRRVAQELMVTCPPLLEILAGM
jgi:hypothetical protein